MAHLTLVGLSEDRTRLLLVDDAGAEYTLDVDTALRSAVRGEQPRPGHLETRMDSALRPRDIQARIRSGESAESVAEAAGSSVDKIMPYAAPVLAERAHVAERAQKSSVRRRAAEGSGSLGGGRTLSEAVAWQLRANNVDPGTVEWDAFRREDGRWTLTGAFAAAGRTGVGTFTFDVPGNYVTPEDDDARWLVGDGARAAEAAPAVTSEPGRRLSAVPSRDAGAEALGDDAIELAAAGREDSPQDADDAEPTVDLTQTLARAREAAPSPAETPDAQSPTTEHTDEESEQAAEPQPRKPAKKRGRASVPSWDEIMFGGGSGE